MITINNIKGLIGGLGFLCAFFSSAMTIDESMILKGEMEVVGGQAEYSLPINLPKGRNNHVPSLEIKYRSDAGVSSLGLGFRINGISSIYRCGKNLPIDGQWGGVNLDEEDRYCLDGERLIAISGEDGADGAEYRLEKNGTERIISYGKSGPEYFKVWALDGSVKEYGNTEDSKLALSNGGIVKWSISQDKDISDNSIFYNYQTVKGDIYVSDIEYVGGKVSFSYKKSRPEDNFYHYILGDKKYHIYRVVDKITLFGNNESEIGSYRFSYAISSGQTPLNRLESLSYCSASFECSTPIHFSWTGQTETSYFDDYTYQLEGASLDFIDVNRDGRYQHFGNYEKIDSLFEVGRGYSIKQLDGTTITKGKEGYGHGGYALKGNEGNLELETQYWHQYTYWESVGSKGTYHKRTAYSLEGPQVFNTSVTTCSLEPWGSRHDKMVCSSDSSQVVGGGLLPSYRPSLDKINQYLENHTLPGEQDDYIGGYTLIPHHPKHLSGDFNGDGFDTLIDDKGGDSITVDINGDGRDDYLRLKSNDFKTLYYAFSGNVDEEKELSLAEFELIRFADINGDGYQDIITKSKDNIVRIYPFDGNEYLDAPIEATVKNMDHGQLIDTTERNTYYDDEGHEYYSENRWFGVQGYEFTDTTNDTHQLFTLYDVNGDGFVDIFDGKQLYLNQMNYTFTPSVYEYDAISNKDDEIRFLDLDSNTAPSLLSLKDNVITVRRNAYHKGNVNYQGVTKVEQIQEHKNLYKLRYVSVSSRANEYAADYEYQAPFSFPNVKFTPVKNVVSLIQKITPQAGDYKNLYSKFSYGGAKHSMNGHGFLGFEEIKETKVANKKVYEVITTNFNQDNEHLIGLPSATTIEKYNDLSEELSVYKQLDFSYEVKVNSGDSGDYYYAYNNKTLTKEYDPYTGSLEKQSTITQTLNDIGLPTSTTEVITGGYEHSGQFNITNDYTYRVNEQQLDASPDDFWKRGAITLASRSIVDLDTRLQNQTTNTYTYSASGLLISDTKTGNIVESESLGADTGANKELKHRYAYDQYGNIAQVEMSGSGLSSSTTQYLYDHKGLHIEKMTNALGHAFLYQYNNFGQLTSEVNLATNRETSYTYDDFQRLTRQINPGKKRLNLVDFEYFTAQYCETHFNIPSPELGVTCQRTYSPDKGEVVTFYNSNGGELRQAHQGFDGQWIVKDTEIDLLGRITTISRPQFLSVTTPAPVVSFNYDTLGREVLKVEPAASDATVSTITSTRYANGQVSKVDAKGHVHTATYNVLGHVIKKTEPLVSTPERGKQTPYQLYKYYPNGLLRHSIDSTGNETHIRYDVFGHRTLLDDPSLGQWHYEYDALGKLINKTDANGIVTTIDYDKLGRKLSATEGERTSSWEYGQSTGLLTAVEGGGLKTTYQYNDVGQVAQETKSFEGEAFVVEYEYDDYERLTREVRPNGNGELASSAGDNPQNRLAVEYIYNPYGYISAIRSPKTYADKVFTSAKFRQDIKTLLEETLEQANQYLTLAEEFWLQQTYFEQKATEYTNLIGVEYALDAASQRLLENQQSYIQQCNDARECYLRPTVWLVSDFYGSVVSQVPSEEGVIYRLDHNGSVNERGVTQYSGNLVAVTLDEYEQQNLLEASTLYVAEDEQGQLYLSSSYLELDDETYQHLIKARHDYVEAAIVATTNYHSATQIADTLIEYSQAVIEVSGLYCEAANQLGGALIDDQRVQCENNKSQSQAEQLNLILTQSELEDSMADPAYVYYWQRRETDAYGHTLSEMLGNGLVNSYRHNARTGRPDLITTHKAGELGAGQQLGLNSPNLVRSLSYRYDVNNNVTRRYDSILGIQDDYTFDGLDRVIGNKVTLDDNLQHGLNNPTLQSGSYQYDLTGNLVLKSDIGELNYADSPYAVSSANGLDYSYDKAGNLTKAVNQATGAIERTVVWSEFNKPEFLSRDGQSAEFSYDANHNRYLKQSSSGLSTFYFNKVYEREQDTLTGEVTHKHFIYAEGKLIALNSQHMDADNELSNKQTRYLHYDALESVDLITNGYGDVVERRSYDIWGNEREVTWETSFVQELITNRGYTGHEHIEEVGLIHMNGRVYDAELGRFLSPDPVIQSPLTTNNFNRYSYVLNNPNKYTDPTGFRHIEDSDSQGSAIAGRDSIDLGGPQDLKREGYRARNGNSRDTGRPVTDRGILDLYIGLKSLFGFNISDDERDYLRWKTVSRYVRGLTYKGYQDIRYEINRYGGLIEGVYDPNFTESNGFVGKVFVEYNGLQYGIFTHIATSEKVIVFAGTQITDINDWKANVAQAVGLTTAQYTRAVAIGRAYIGQDITFAGHSLGGGLATVAAIASANKAVTINSAGVHNNTIEGVVRDGWSVNNYFSGEDGIRTLNAMTPTRLRGNTINVGYAGVHGLSSFRKKFE
ncbi:RHS repeat-associated core domain-containing protein [Vibrio hippocampi]|uniref:Insecticide toxin TcdB middle/N-terminal domain-containing protein n=1 Tax=Vibrio hippocampi TaxID=654686 RepID=A0ABM8ZGN4_9VIBR|nr:RHS repeat-associated core domain-containing protein [Vibrio hippocampi]CAH0524617.1 hypothetical protein VHP8226_00465 [Vibrio hippocampi]